MRKLSILLAALAAFTVVGAAYASNGKERVVVERFEEPFSFTVDCSEFGPYDFENVVSGTQRVRVTEVLAKDGTVLQTVFHVQFKETDTNSRTGRSLPLRGSVNEVWDYASSTRTLRGAVFIGTAHGEGTWVQDTGRITITLDMRIAQFVAGPHEAFFAGGVDGLACAALAGS